MALSEEADVLQDQAAARQRRVVHHPGLTGLAGVGGPAVFFR